MKRRGGTLPFAAVVFVQAFDSASPASAIHRMSRHAARGNAHDALMRGNFADFPPSLSLSQRTTTAVKLREHAKFVIGFSRIPGLYS